MISAGFVGCSCMDGRGNRHHSGTAAKMGLVDP